MTHVREPTSPLQQDLGLTLIKAVGSPDLGPSLLKTVVPRILVTVSQQTWLATGAVALGISEEST